jgi:hypothetical protein
LSAMLQQQTPGNNRCEDAFRREAVEYSSTGDFGGSLHLPGFSYGKLRSPPEFSKKARIPARHHSTPGTTRRSTRRSSGGPPGGPGGPGGHCAKALTRGDRISTVQTRHTEERAEAQGPQWQATAAGGGGGVEKAAVEAHNTTPADGSEIAEARQSAYMVKEERQWDTFRRSTIGHTHAHKVLGVLTLIFVPRGYDELDFAYRQSFMYSSSLMSSERHMGKVSFVNTSTLLMHKACGCDS